MSTKENPFEAPEHQSTALVRASSPLTAFAENAGTFGFALTQDFELEDGTKASSAYRIHFSWKGFIFLGQYALVIERENATVQDFTALFDEGFELSRQAVPWWFFRGVQCAYMVVPIIATRNPSPELVEFVVNPAPKHWSVFEFPVLVDLDTNQVHNYTDTALWGAFFFSDMRTIVKELLG